MPKFCAKVTTDATKVVRNQQLLAICRQRAALPPTLASSAAAAPTSFSVGATLATRGRWADKLPACEQCHGPGGSGVGQDFPALAGQSASYLANQLTAWKTGARAPGPMGLMAVVAKKLSEAEVRAVADHYASLPAKDAR